MKLIDHSDMLGKTFGFLEVVEVLRHDGKHYWYRCNCLSCGNTEYEIRRSQLNKYEDASCGCGKTRHGLMKSLEYLVWIDMKQRCFNPNSVAYPDYGARGITITPRWLEPKGKGLLNFIEDLGPRLDRSYTIERIDVNLNYCPENCMWTNDASLQAYNKRARTDNTSGKIGVGWDEKISGTKKWKVQISYKDIRKTKRFYTFEEAVAQRKAWELELYGFNLAD